MLAAFIVIPRGQGSIAWFMFAALLAMAVLSRVGGWYKRRRLAMHIKGRSRAFEAIHYLSQRRVAFCLVILLALMFSKFFYTAGLTNFYIFYLMDRFGLPIGTAQIYLFAFLASVALGTLVGGPLGDRIGRKYVIWGSILGVFPFTLALPYAGLFWTGILTVADRRDHGVGLLGHPGLCAGTHTRAGRDWSAGCSSGWPSAWRASPPRCSAGSPTGRASAMCTGSARSCRSSAC